MSSEITTAIHKNKPQLSESSVRAYVSTLRNLFKKVEGKFPEGDEVKKFESEHEKFIAHLKDKPPQARTSVYAALFVVAPIDAYKEALEADTRVYRDNLNKMEKTPEQMQNWVSQKDIMVKLAAVRSSVTHAMKAMSPDWRSRSSSSSWL